MPNSPPNWLSQSTTAAKDELKSKIKTATTKNSPKIASPKKEWIAPSSQTGVASTYWVEKFVAADNAAITTPPKQAVGHAAQLLALVTKIIDDEPLEREGRMWAARKKAWYSEKVGVSERQLQRIAAQTPLISRVKIVNGERLVLMRPYKAGDRTPEDYARIMAHIWRSKVSKGKNVSSAEFGLLVGIAKDLDIFAPDVFATVLDNWSAFMANAKIAIAIAQVEGDFYEEDPEKFVSKYYKFPSISVIRRFWKSADDTFDTLYQFSSKPIP